MEPDNYSFSGLLLSDISDHLPIFYITHDQFNDMDVDAYTVYRDKSEVNVSRFRHCLDGVFWHDLDGFCDPTKAYESFLNKYREIYNNCFPLKRKKNKKCTLTKPWISKGLLKSIRRKDKLYKRYLNTPDYVNEASYKNYKNKLNHSLRIAKRLYYDKQLDNFKTNTKNTWRILNEVINKKKRVGRLPSTFIFDNQEISNSNEIANHFCDYFTNIGVNLSRKISDSTISHRSYLSGNFVNSLFLFSQQLSKKY